MTRSPLVPVLALLAAGCSSDRGPSATDLSVATDLAQVDLAAPLDLAVPPDLSQPDLALAPWTRAFKPSGCDLKINTNSDGTVNPFVNTGKMGRFWVSYVAKSNPHGDLMLASVDPKACQTKTGPLRVNDTVGGVYYWGAQSVTSDVEGDFYAVWEIQPGSHVGFSRSQDGATFSPTYQLDSFSQNGLFPSISTRKHGEVHAAWTGLSGGQYDAFYRKNLDVLAGATWSIPAPVAKTAMQDNETAIAIDAAGNVIIAFASLDNNVFVARSTNGGATFSAPVQVNDVANKAEVGIGTFMTVGPDGTIHVVWQDTRTDTEGDLRSDSSGPFDLVFGNDVMVADSTARWQEDPSVVAAQGGPCRGVLWAVWQDLRGNKDYDIYGSRSIDGGRTWEKNVVVTPNSAGDQMNPSLSVDGTCQVGIAWRDSSVNREFDVRATFVEW